MWQCDSIPSSHPPTPLPHCIWCMVSNVEVNKHFFWMIQEIRSETWLFSIFAEKQIVSVPVAAPHSSLLTCWAGHSERWVGALDKFSPLGCLPSVLALGSPYTTAIRILDGTVGNQRCLKSIGSYAWTSQMIFNGIYWLDIVKRLWDITLNRSTGNRTTEPLLERISRI